MPTPYLLKNADHAACHSCINKRESWSEQRIAYAHLMYRPEKSISEVLKRLEAIKGFTNWIWI